MRHTWAMRIPRRSYRQKFLLWKVEDYATYAALGRQHPIDFQALMAPHALNCCSIMLLSFRASREGEQHVDHLSQNASGLATIPCDTRRSSPRCLSALARDPGLPSPSHSTPVTWC